VQVGHVFRLFCAWLSAFRFLTMEALPFLSHLAANRWDGMVYFFTRFHGMSCHPGCCLTHCLPFPASPFANHASSTATDTTKNPVKRRSCAASWRARVCRKSDATRSLHALSARSLRPRVTWLPSGKYFSIFERENKTQKAMVRNNDGVCVVEGQSLKPYNLDRLREPYRMLKSRG